jgi:Mg-chelatase subunit ChlD
MRPLSTDISGARSFVQTLTPAGNTNITIGVQWGMEALSPEAPLTGGVNFGDTETRKFMIIVTDGQNTRNRFTSNTSQIDDRTKKACQAANANNITVYVVRVMEGNSALLKGCASKEDYYYDLKSAAQLNDALASIFDSIRKSRLTK